MGTFLNVLTRKKQYAQDQELESHLGRVLTTLDLTALGVGSTLGVGVYVIAGHVAKEVAGPAVILSFVFAAIVSALSGLCYAEFGARVPKAGSAYIYSYVCIGELIAFIIGWNLILEYVIGSASVARGLSLYLDTLTNNTLKEYFTEIAPINVNFFSPYFDLFSFGISLLLSIALAFGLKKSTIANNIFTAANLIVVLFVIIAGAIYSKSQNWELTSVPSNAGSGGFFPFGVEGVIKGVAICFYGFIGFDSIATSGEEVQNPKRSIPIAIVLTLFIVFLSYFGTSTVLTMMVPYYMQDSDAPLPFAFMEVGLEYAKWIVGIGGLFGLCASLFGSMFPLPRIIYSMAHDGIIFRFLGIINDKYKTPVIGTLLAGLITGLTSALFNLKDLVNMMSIGTLLAYTVVSASVLLLRYSPKERFAEESKETTHLINTRKITAGKVFKQIIGLKFNDKATHATQQIIYVTVILYCALSLLLGLCLKFSWNEIINGEIWAIVLTSVFAGLLIIIVLSLSLQPKADCNLSFKVPLVPLIPALSIFINIYLMLMLDYATWIRFGIWMVVGIPIYLYCVLKTKTSNVMPILNAPIKGENNIGFIPDSFDEMKEIENEKSMANGKAHPIENEYIKISQKITHVDEVVMNIEESEVQQFSSFNPETIGRKSVDVRYAIGLLDEVINNEEDNETSNEQTEKEAPIIIPPPDSGARKISIDAESLNSNKVHVIGSDFALVHREDIKESIHEQSNDTNKEQSKDTDVKHAENKTQIDLNQNNVNEKKQESSQEDSKIEKPNAETKEASNSSPPKPTLIIKPQKEQAPKPPATPPMPPPPVPLRSPIKRNFTVPVKDKSLTPSPQSSPQINAQKPFSIPLKSLSSTSSSNNSPNMSRQMSEENLEDPPENKNVTMGSKSHNQIASKLERILQQRSLRKTKGFTKPVYYNEEKPESVQDEDVSKKSADLMQSFARASAILKDDKEEHTEDDSIVKPSDFKRKLNELMSVRASMMKPKKKDDQEQEHNENVTQQEKQINGTDPNSYMPEDELIKNVMGNVFQSIKLRKVDSFKINEDNNSAATTM